MGATVEAARGPIEEVTHIRYGISPEAAKAEHLATMDQVMQELGPVLAQPVYEGDVQTALIHNMGRDAFGVSGMGDDRVRGYIGFSEAIDADTAEGPTPVLVVSQVQPGQGTKNNTETALVMVDSEAVFRSSLVHERGVHSRGHADKVAITRRILSLVGDTSTIHADISGYGSDHRQINPYAKKTTGETELVLDERSIIDGKNGSKPIAIGHDGYNRDVERASVFSGPKHIVGWENIGAALAARIYGHPSGYRGEDQQPENPFSYILKLRGFFERAGQLEALLAHNNPLKKMFEQAVSLDNSISALAPPSDHED